MIPFVYLAVNGDLGRIVDLERIKRRAAKIEEAVRTKLEK
jgi:hypothetical protein